MIYRQLLLLFIPIFITFSTCSSGKHRPFRNISIKADTTVRLQILTINDFHGQITFTTKMGNDYAGSAPVLDAYLKAAVARERNTIIVEAGDLVGASAIASALLQDEPAIRFFNQLGNSYCSCGADKFNEACNLIGIPGNHEFDAGIDELKRLLNGGTHKTNPYSENPWLGAAFPVISANIKYKSNGKLVFPPYIIKHIDGVQVAFIGATYSQTPSIVKNADIDKLLFINEADGINSCIQEIKNKGIKAIIAIIHNGGTQRAFTGMTAPESKDLNGPILSILERLDPEIDVVITAHTHSFTNTSYKTLNGNLLLVTQAYSKGEGYADINLEIDRESGEIVNKRAAVVVTHANKGPALRLDHRVVSFTKNINARIAPIVNRSIGNAKCDISKVQNSDGESALGNLVADAQKAVMNTDFAFINSNGLRTNLRAGNITWGKLYYMQPFNNNIVKMTLTGQQIVDLLNQQWINRKGRPNILQISGLNYLWDSSRPDSNRVVEVYKDNIPLNRKADYTVAVTSFLSGGGDNFNVLLQGRDKITGPVDLKALEEYITDCATPVSIDIQNRIRQISLTP
jgi:5'-nucleotidase